MTVFKWDSTDWTEPCVRGPMVMGLMLWCDILARTSIWLKD